MASDAAQVRDEGRLAALKRLDPRRGKRIPLISQVAATDCGAACIAIVLGFHGKHVGLREVREVTGVSRQGTDALSLLQVGRIFGLRGRGLKIDQIEDLKLLPRGSILHWRFNHFVVFDSLRGDRASIVDPSEGRRVIRREELERSFTGVALTLEPAEDFETRAKSQDQGVRKYLNRILAQKALLVQVLTISVLVQLFALAIPILTGLLVDRVAPRRDYHLLMILGFGMAAVVGFNLLASLVRAHLLLYLRTRLDARLTLDFLDHLVDLPYSFFQLRSTGDLMMRLNSNSTIREILTSGALSAILDGTLVTLYLIVLLGTDLRMGAVVLALGVLRIAVFFATRRRQRELMSESLQAEAQSRGYQVQMLSGMGTLKSAGAEHRAVEHWSNLFVDVMNVSLSRGRLMATIDSTMSTLQMASPLIILSVGALRVLSGDLTLGTMLALSALGAAFLQPLSQLVGTGFQLQLLGSYFERINDVLETPREQEGREVTLAPRLLGGLAADKVSFRYSINGPPVIEEISFEIRPGQFVAVVGRSGAGKSTLAHLLMGLYQPSEGRILIDGLDLGSLDLRSVRRQLGIVPQEPFLFGATLRANIAFNDPRLPLGEVVAAAKRAHIHEDITAMAMGYETTIADAGATLSGGQRQRMALARALVHRPPILILDEATSSLDAETERLIQRELESLRCTRVVIAHRLSTIKKADHILVMDAGKVAESGNHSELLALGGIYSELVSDQLDEHESPDLRESGALAG